MNRRAIITLSLAHTVTDMSQGALPAMLPFLMVERHLDYAAAAGLVFASTAVSPVIQPIFGQMADRWSLPWMMPLGLFVAALGIALAGVAPGYGWALVAVIFSGIGVAAFHPAAARSVNHAAGERRATSMGLFSFGGNAGFAIGPLLTTAVLLTTGLNGALLLVIPAALMAALLTSQLPRLSAIERSAKGRSLKTAAGVVKDEWGLFSRLTAAIVIRSIIFYGLNTFLPLYWVNVMRQDKAAGGIALAIMLWAGALGTLALGWLADRYGRRTMALTMLVALTPLLAIFVMLNNVLLATLLLVPLGFTLIGPTSVLAVMGQDYLPNHIGMASGVTLGLAMSVGGLAAPILGVVGDNYGLHTVLLALAFMPLPVIALVLTLPSKVRRDEDEKVAEAGAADMAQPDVAVALADAQATGN